MSFKIALVGNPNSGKTTLFNSLTGTNQHVGNWPGVTVEKKEGKLKHHKDMVLVDLPGIYSLSPYSLEEVISRNYILEEHPDAIIDIVDGTNLERNLYLTTQLIETGIPVIIAVNMMDVVEKNQDKIRLDLLERYFNSQVVKLIAINQVGIDDLLIALDCVKTKRYDYKPTLWYSKEIEEAMSEISVLIRNRVKKEQLRWFAIKLFERDEETQKHLSLSDDLMTSIDHIIKPLEDNMEYDTETLITEQRYKQIGGIYEKVYQRNKIRDQRRSDKIDRIVTNKWLALPIFAVVIFLVYYISISTVGRILTDFVNDIIFGDGGVPDIVRGWLQALSAPVWLEGVLVDGIIGGVGAVLGFLPQMFVLFVMLAVLEESGYMARVAFILDRIFRRFGLSGKSFIPMLISTGCAIPGVMAARTIEDENNRKLTIMTTSFMPCGAKLPIIALIAGALFRNTGIHWLIAPSAYFIGMGTIVVSGIILKKFKSFAGNAAPFIMELPDYNIPRLRSLNYHVWNKLKSFVRKAGTIILVASVIVWFMASFDFSLHMTENIETSIMAGIGKVIYHLFIPLGWGDWKAAVATFTGLVAKENVVGTFGVLYGFAEVGEDGAEIWSVLARDFTMLSAYSFLIFNLICAPCFAAIGAIRREMGSRKWTWIAVLFQTGLAYILALIVYQVGSVFVGNFTFGSIVGFVLLAGLLYLLFRKNKYVNTF